MHFPIITLLMFLALLSGVAWYLGASVSFNNESSASESPLLSADKIVNLHSPIKKNMPHSLNVHDIHLHNKALPTSAPFKSIVITTNDVMNESSSQADEIERLITLCLLCLTAIPFIKIQSLTSAKKQYSGSRTFTLMWFIPYKASLL